jgi:hypothetical protein
MKATLANTINHTVPAKGEKKEQRERERERERTTQVPS